MRSLGLFLQILEQIRLVILEIVGNFEIFAFGFYDIDLLDVDKAEVVQFIRVSSDDGPSGVSLPKHHAFTNHSWMSGRGLYAGAGCGRVVQLYGEPDSRSPSTKDQQRLELLYYAFDWAGPDVPQMMEVLCTAEKDGKPGRVIEITLSASSL